MIIDIVLIILVVLALIYGLYKGFAGVLLGFIGSIIIAIAIGVGLFFIAPNVMFNDKTEGVSVVIDENGESIQGYTGMFMLLYEPISNAMIDPEDSLLGAELVKVDDLLQLKVKNENGDTTVKFSVAVKELVPFFDSDSDAEDDEINGEIAAAADDVQTVESEEGIPMLDEFITKYGCEGLTVAHALAAFVTLVVWCAILWLVLFIVLMIVKIIIRRLIFRTLDRHSVASKIDRAIGAVVAVAVIICVAWLAVSIAGVIVPGFGLEESFSAQMESNPICGFFAEHSMIGNGSSVPSDEPAQTLANSVTKVISKKIY